MTVRDDIRRALYDAIDWQYSLAGAWSKGSPERQEALDQAKKYRAILKRRYGEAQHHSRKVFDGAKALTLDEIRASTWPSGCHDPDSCSRHKQCMYTGCSHGGKDIASEIDAATFARLAKECP